ncbi:thioredoxin family protein [Pontimicrobium sp. SW4]|uniref:Thioredoxin family protein n=1 Tax=Pontimicrobium sp. SW4 TaxID=3153519 RepID=A0AAU7BU72_9FLAO
MKKIVITFVLVFAVNLISAQDINWVTIEEAVELQKKTPKKIMIDMYTVWCGPCKLMDRITFKNKDVVAYVNEHYYAVKFNAEGNDELVFNGRVFSNPNYEPARAKSRNSAHQLTRYFQVSAYPTVVFLDEDLKMLVPLRGVKKPQELELYLKMFKKDEHKNIKSQDAFTEYYKAFKPEFTEK